MKPMLHRRRLLVSLGLVVLSAGGAGYWFAASGRPANEVGLVFKSPTCGCCTEWTEHMAAAGFPLEVEHVSDLSPVKREHGVPYGMSSCHTASIEGYVIEGHVPAGEVRRLLNERPDAIGLAVPGMPIGSPGMEGPGAQPYTVFLMSRDGSARSYARIHP